MYQLKQHYVFEWWTCERHHGYANLTTPINTSPTEETYQVWHIKCEPSLGTNAEKNVKNVINRIYKYLF